MEISIKVGFACDIAVVGCFFAWPFLSRFSDTQLLFVMIAISVAVLVVAPLIGIAISRPVFDWFDRQFSAAVREQ